MSTRQSFCDNQYSMLFKFQLEENFYKFVDNLFSSSGFLRKAITRDVHADQLY